MSKSNLVRVCGRVFSDEDLERVREQAHRARLRLRAEIARRVCDVLQWHDALGRPKLMSCRVALLRLHRAGLIELPAPHNGNGNGNGKALSRRQAPDQPLCCRSARQQFRQSFS